jgi:hypothetical protein
MHEDKDVKIEWLSPDVLNYILPRSGDKFQVSFENMSEFAQVFQRRAEEILQHFGVPDLTPEQLQSVKDPLGLAGVHVSLLTYNDKLASELSKGVTITVKDEKLLTELHLCGITITCISMNHLSTSDKRAVDILSALEGCGHLRFTEAVSQLNSQPTQFDRRCIE